MSRIIAGSRTRARARRVRVQTALAIALTAHTLLARPAASQEPADTFFLGELVVSATHVPIPRAAVPAAVTVLQGAELRARGVRFVADALREVAGASLVRGGSTGGLTSLFLRGGESDYVLVMVDGVVLNDPGGAIDLGQLTTDEVDRIEVVRGPASVLYGSDAVTGVVHVITRADGGPPRARASVEMGTADRRSGDLARCGGACPAAADLSAYRTRRLAAGVSAGTGPLRWTVGISDFRSDGAYPFNNAYTNRTMSARVDAGGVRGDAALTARWTDGLYRYPTDGAGRLVDANTFRSSESLALGLDAARWWGERVETRLALSLHDGDYATVDDPDGPADTLGFYASLARTRVDRRKADLHVNVHAAPGTVATLGVELERQQGASDVASESDFGPFESASENERSNRAVYGQLASSPHPRLSLTAGARTERNDRFGSFLTWRAGANLRPARGTLLRWAAGTAFKEPTFFENYAEGFTRGNPALEPERSRSWEVGVERTLASGRATVAATWFDQRFRNLIMYTGSPEPGEPNYVNLGEARSRGLEVEARLASAAGHLVVANWVRLLTEVVDAGTGEDPLFEEGEALVRRPRDRINLSGSTPIAGRGRVGATLAYVGERADLDFATAFAGERVALPAHTVVDLFGEARVWTSGDGGLSLQLRVENVLGRAYEEVVNFPGPRRALYLGASATTGF